MLPFEFCIKGPPVSLQTKKRARLQSWKNDVKIAAQKELKATSNVTTNDVSVVITYYYEGNTPDVDNIIKPILDALNGVFYIDDSQVKDVRSKKREINSSYKVRGASPVILSAFSIGDEFLHVKLAEFEETEVLS